MVFFYYCIHSRFLIVWYNMIYTSKEQNSQCGLSYFSGTLMLSSIMFYYLSRFLIVLIHFIVNGEPLFISSLFLILTCRKSRGHLSALSESLSQFKWIFKTFIYFYTVHYIRLFFWIFITCRFYSRKNTPETNHFQIYY